MLVIHNTGGTAQLSATHALQTVHSGPVAGTSASELLAREWDLGNVVATDMGGTSFDISLSVKGGIKHYDFYPVIDRWLVSVPMIHLVTLGAGGGSIARYDPVFKAIQVGPASAGSNPGPACYDAGGLDPTTTDANLILGYLDAERYASGSLKLNAKRAEQALGDLADDVSDARGTELSVIGVAHHIRTRAEQNMANGIAKELGVRGYNPREFTFVAYGGNGPMHCCGIADKLEIKKVLVPPFPSVFSALGVADMAQLHIHEKSVHISVYDSIRRTLADDFSELNATIETLEASGQQDLERQGHPADAVRHTLEIDMRYGNQLVETSVVSKQPRIRSVNEILDLIGTFGEDYEARFGKGSSAPEAGIVISGVRVKSYLESLNLELPEPEATRHPAGVPDATRTCYFNGSEEPVETSVYYAEQLDSGTVIPGPALVEAATTTYVVPPGWQQVVVGNQGAAWLERV
jgi:N-methylhydantoinase A